MTAAPVTALEEFTGLVDQLVRQTSMERTRAEGIIRRNFPALAARLNAPRVVPKTTPADEGRAEPLNGFARDPNIDEDEEQEKVVELFRAYGAVVRSTSQKRPSKIALGLADLIVMFPTRGFALWWETKRQVGGEQRPDQRQFEDDCRASGWTYRLGDRYDVARYLLNLGLAEEGDGPLGIVPARSSNPTL